MSETDPPTPPGAPVPGWYHDANGTVRWWDGAGWTEHVQVPGIPSEQPGAGALAPGFEPTMMPATAEPSGPRYLPWIVALGSVLALCVAAVLIIGSLGGDDGAPTDAIPSDDVVDVQAALRSAQTAIETYAVEHGGSYAGATPEELAAIDGSLSGVPLTVTGEAGGYTLSAPAGDVTFTITRDSSGVVAFTCTPAGGGGCDETGSWGLAA